MVYRLTLSYHGAAYAGWQRQENAVAVQEVLEGALSDLLAQPIQVAGSSRTDSGVHARGQMAHLTLAAPFPERAEGGERAERALVHGTNHRLPRDVRVLAAHRMRDGFHAQRSAAGKEYVYRLSRAEVLSPLDAPFVVPVQRRIDLAAIRDAAAALPGHHDFSAFALAGGNHQHAVRRIVSARFQETDDEIAFHIVGDGFLRGMVRTLVGTLIDVGLGRRTADGFTALLAGGNRALAGPTAPAHGLTLLRVFYPPEWRVEGDPEMPEG